MNEPHFRSQTRADEALSAAIAAVTRAKRLQEEQLLKEMEAIKRIEAKVPVQADLICPPWIDNKEPLPFDVFCYELDQCNLFERQADAWDHAGMIGDTQTGQTMLRARDLFNPARTINEWILVWGKRSGKDFLSSKFIAYIPYVLSHFAVSPCSWMARAGNLDLSPHTRIDIVNVAPNAELAAQVFFEYLKGHLRHPLFRQFPIYPAVEQWKPGTNHIMFGNINLHLYSKTSKSSGLDGFNLLAFVMDEADAFLDNGEKSNADDIYGIFHRTAISTFGPFYNGLVISWPRFEEGFIKRMEKRARKSPHLYYVDLAATDVVRPNWNRNDPRVIEDYENDPRGARAMYDCQPMSVGDAFIEFPDKIAECVDARRSPVAMIDEVVVTRPHPDGKEIEYVCAVASSITPQPGAIYFLSGDGGLSGDAFGVCVMHVDTTNDAAEWLCPYCAANPVYLRFATYEKLLHHIPGDQVVRCGMCAQTPMQRSPMGGLRGWYHKISEPQKVLTIDGKQYHIPHIYEDLLIQIKPHHAWRPGERDRVVDWPGMERLMEQLILTLSPQQVRLDPWNTAQMTQNLRNTTGVDVDQISFSAAEQFLRARLYKSMLYGHHMTLLVQEVRDREVRRLQRTRTMVDHPKGPNESKDLYDTEAICVWLAVNNTNTQFRLDWSDPNERQGNPTVDRGNDSSSIARRA